MKKTTRLAIESICDQFVNWQEEDGSISKERCPYFHEEYKPFFRYMEVPFMARCMYQYYDISKIEKYKVAADKYSLFYVHLICDLITTERIAYKFGMALEAASLYAKYNPLKSQEMKVYNELFDKWLRQLINESLGSYFRCGYMVSKIPEAIDVGFSDDLCHVGRGLVRAYELLKDQAYKDDFTHLAHYFATEQKANTQDGIWNSKLGTWAIGPWPDKNFEHMSDTAACDSGWVFSAYGDAEYLIDAMPYLDDKLVANLKTKCITSIKWIFEQCMFEDGAIGMRRKDDKWLGLTGAGILGAVKLYEKDLLNEEEIKYFKVAVAKAWKYLTFHVGNNLPVAGYIEDSGETNPIPGDNVAWLLAWVVEALEKETIIDKMINE